MAQHFVTATYWIETPLEIERAASALAGEQSCGTFVRVPGETDELRSRALARIAKITPLDDSDAASLPGGRQAPEPDGRYRRALLRIEFPFDNIGVNLPTVMATVAGNLFELREFSGLRLLDIEFPAPFATCLRPQFGIAGTRRLAGVEGRPLIGTIVKPSVGLSPAQTAALVGQLADADIDFIKDDELMANPPHSPLEQRVEAVMSVINAAADRSGKKVMYAFNVSDEPDEMRRHHDLVLKHGGTCVMVSLHHVGVSGLLHLRRHSQLPIHGHRNGWGIYSRSPAIGIDYVAMQKLWRLAGVDHLHVNGLKNKFCESDDSVVRSIQSCLTPLFSGDGVDDRAMPVVSSGQWGGQAPDTYSRTGTIDVIYLAGGGVMAHPGGPPAGTRALRQAWEAAVTGVPLETYAETHAELRQSIERFGRGATS
jgi:ribulose-bisphosphate carboxylase large chain